MERVVSALLMLSLLAACFVSVLCIVRKSLRKLCEVYRIHCVLCSRGLIPFCLSFRGHGGSPARGHCGQACRLQENIHEIENVKQTPTDRYMDELTIMEVPEPPSMGTTGSLLMEQIPQVRQRLTRGHDWDDIALKATSSDGGVFCTYDDANDPDVKSVAALFAAGEHEQWGDDPDASAAAVTTARTGPGEPSAAAVAAVEAARAAKAEASRNQEAPASSVHA